MFRSEIAGHVPILENALQKTYKTLKYQLDKKKIRYFQVLPNSRLVRSEREYSRIRSEFWNS